MLRFLKKYDTYIVLIGSLILCLVGIGMYPIYILDESKNAEAAREMLLNNNFIVPTFNNVLRTDKPPLHYFFMILGYKLFGVGAFGARFFSGVFGVLTVFTSFWFTKRFLNQKLSWILVLVIWSSVFFIQEFHLAVPDPYLIFFISFAFWCFIAFEKTSHQLWLLGFYTSLGLGVLTKGPVAIALPGLVCLIYIVYTKQLRTLFRFKPILGGLLILLIALPWYIKVHFDTDGLWTQGFFLDHNINRFSSEMEGHGGLFVITWLFVLLGLMPSSFFIFYAVKNIWKDASRDDTIVFATIVSFVFVLFFSVSGTKLPNYTMPCYPFLALLIAKGIYDVIENGLKDRLINVGFWSVLVLSILLPITGKIALSIEKELNPVSNIAWVLLLVTIPTVVAFVFYRKEQLTKAFLILSSGWVFLSPILFLVVYPILTEQSPVTQARSVLTGDKSIAVFQRFDAAFPINYQQTYLILKDVQEVDSFFKKHPDGVLMTNGWNSKLLDEKEYLQQVFKCKALFESHTTRIYKMK